MPEACGHQPQQRSITFVISWGSMRLALMLVCVHSFKVAGLTLICCWNGRALDFCCDWHLRRPYQAGQSAHLSVPLVVMPCLLPPQSTVCGSRMA